MHGECGRVAFSLVGLGCWWCAGCSLDWPAPIEGGCGGSSGGGANCEIRVKLPQSQLAVVSSTMPLENAPNILDGDTNTHWVMEPSAWPQEFVVSLGESCAINAIEFYEDWSYIKDYSLYVGSPESWGVAVKTGSVPGSGLQSITFPEKTGTHLRVVIESSSNDSTYAYLTELDVYAAPK